MIFAKVYNGNLMCWFGASTIVVLYTDIIFVSNDSHAKAFSNCLMIFVLTIS